MKRKREKNFFHLRKNTESYLLHAVCEYFASTFFTTFYGTSFVARSFVRFNV